LVTVHACHGVAVAEAGFESHRTGSARDGNLLIAVAQSGLL
jgi:hypothetical protein